MFKNMHCEGCCDYEIHCSYVTGNDGSCPCTICAVKMVCANTCENWHTWRIKESRIFHTRSLNSHKSIY